MAASPTSSPPPDHHHHHHNFLHFAAGALLSVLPNPKPASPSPPLSPSRICVPLQFVEKSPFDCSSSKSPAQVKGSSSSSSSSSAQSNSSGSAFPSMVRIAGLGSDGRGGSGPAFVGQVFSMCDLTGTGLMAVSTHFDIPFISKRKYSLIYYRTPEWLKKIFATVTKSERKGPVFRFFMDLGDAVAYVKRLNIPSGVVGACRLDLAYEHFKEKPNLFQFIPNEKQVKAANQLLKTLSDGRKRVDGVPVFSAQNLDIAIATTDGIKWYTPYFFDKDMLDNILEESVDQHFQSLIQTRHLQRRRDVIDDNLAAEVIEEMGDSLIEPPEVQEVLDEMGHPGIPLSVISKAAEIQLLYAVDKVLLGNRWLRKATGIQPKFPYMVDSFEKRSAFSIRRASESTSCLPNSGTELEVENNVPVGPDLRLPLGDWFSHAWWKQHSKPKSETDLRMEGSSRQYIKQKIEISPFLPKITMVGISTGEAGQMSKASLKKTMEDLTKELEQTERGQPPGNSVNRNELKSEDRDPLFVANVGEYYSGMSKTCSPRWIRGRNN